MDANFTKFVDRFFNIGEDVADSTVTGDAGPGYPKD